MPNRKTLLVGTRESALARLQTDIACNLISQKFPELNFEILPVKTSGDRVLNKPLAEMGGRGVFVKELEEFLLAGKVDFVVHSLKDLPTEMPAELKLAATIDRADPRDVLLAKNNLQFTDLPAKSRVATSSRRRAAQLRALRSDLDFVDIRGNIQTRLRKLEENQCDAMVLAAAGIVRLGLSEKISQYFSIDESTPAVGQGALALQCRNEESEIISILHAVNESSVWSCTQAERAFLKKLGGGCSLPVGAYARILDDSSLELRACVSSLDGLQILKDTACGDCRSAVQIGEALADRLIEKGAAKIVESLLSGPASAVSAP